MAICDSLSLFSTFRQPMGGLGNHGGNGVHASVLQPFNLNLHSVLTKVQSMERFRPLVISTSPEALVQSRVSCLACYPALQLASWRLRHSGYASHSMA